MKDERDIRFRRRIRNMILSLVFTGILLSVATYAWFIGMRTVNVESFEVKIAAAKDLELSLNGENWHDSITISSNTFSDPDAEFTGVTGDELIAASKVYEGNTNWWAGRGLIPVSTVGEIDSATSRLIMFEKTSLTVTRGGYRLIASQVPNDGTSEVDGYVAFDLFIRNHGGADYIESLVYEDEEAIYLSRDSRVDVSLEGEGSTGIQNSVRVAFAQIGRVKGTTADSELSADINKITGINCTGGDGVTSICSRNAIIWEPNDTAHVSDAIKWYDNSCRKRTDADLTDPNNYDVAGTCLTIADGQYLKTYAINDEISVADQVDVYDGDFNDWEASTKVQIVETFTDTMKNVAGIDRPSFMTLAPNSVTKVRVYVYIEGQDIDNYDFAQLGKGILVNFGITKQRLSVEDLNSLSTTQSTTE